LGSTFTNIIFISFIGIRDLKIAFLQPHKPNRKMQKSYPTNAPTTPDRQTTDERRAADNKGLAKCGVMCYV